MTGTNPQPTRAGAVPARSVPCSSLYWKGLRGRADPVRLGPGFRSAEPGAASVSLARGCDPCGRDGSLPPAGKILRRRDAAQTLGGRSREMRPMNEARWRIRNRTALAAVIVAGLAAGAPNPAAGQEGREVFPFPVTTFELENGLRVVGVDYDSPGIVAYYTVVRTGSRNEVEPGFSGYAHFFEHMMFRGTDKLPDRGLQRRGARGSGPTRTPSPAATGPPTTSWRARMPSRPSWISSRTASSACATARTTSARRPAPSSGSTT